MSQPIRICFTYKPVDAPWGGANNFIRALSGVVQQTPDFVMVDTIDEPADILFMNQLGKGPAGDGAKYTLADVKAWRKRNPTGKVVVRAVNLRAHSHPREKWGRKLRSFLSDLGTLRLLKLADFVIFQSGYQRGFFVQHGYRGSADRVIHNGSATLFDSRPEPVGDDIGDLILLSSAMAGRKTKRHDLVARLSALPGVQVRHAGNWPEKLPPQNVVQLGVLDHAALKEQMAQADYFLHPAQYDPCPNALIEALHFGLPAIYHPGPGSSAEIVRENGIALHEEDLAATLKAARNRREALHAGLAPVRGEYGVATAAAAYMDVFRQVVGAA